jgi:hypothetical protein
MGAKRPISQVRRGYIRLWELGSERFGAVHGCLLRNEIGRAALLLQLLL